MLHCNIHRYNHLFLSIICSIYPIDRRVPTARGQSIRVLNRGIQQKEESVVSSLIPYSSQSVQAVAPSQIPHIPLPTNNSRIYLYYYSPSLTSESSIALSTFIFLVYSLISCTNRAFSSRIRERTFNNSIY